jgi:hypothetical protein
MPPLLALAPEVIAGVADAAAVGGEAAAVGGEAAAAGGEAAAAGADADAAGGEAAGSSSFSDIMDGVDMAQNFLPTGPSNNSAPSSPVPFSGGGLSFQGPTPVDYTTGLGGGGGGSGDGLAASGGPGSAGGAGGFDGSFSDLASGADFNNTNSLLGIQAQADQQQTMMELAAKLESMQKETDQFIIQNM